MALCIFQASEDNTRMESKSQVSTQGGKDGGWSGGGGVGETEIERRGSGDNRQESGGEEERIERSDSVM